MYSVIKSQKKKLSHDQESPVTSSIFLNNSEVLFTFKNGVYMIINIHSENQISFMNTIPENSFVTKSERIQDGRAVLVGKNASFIYVLKLTSDKTVQLQKICGGLFWNILQQNPLSNLVNIFGCETSIFGFNYGSFAIKHYLYEDKKIIIDWFSSKLDFKAFSQEIYLELDGQYHLEICDKQNGQLAFYKEQQIVQALWKIKIFSFRQKQVLEKQIILPSQIFHEEIILKQIVKWLDDSYLIICFDSESVGEWKTYLAFLHLNPQIQPHKNFDFLKKSPLMKEIYFTDLKKEIFYTIVYTNERIQGQLYQNGIIVSNMKTGEILEKGFCSLKNTSISPDGRYILDVPSQMESYGYLFFHLRLLLSKQSLYLFLIDKSELQILNDSFKEEIVSLL